MSSPIPDPGAVPDSPQFEDLPATEDADLPPSEGTPVQPVEPGRTTSERG